MKNKRSLLIAAPCFALSFVLFIYAPFELYLTNQMEFWFTPRQMLPYALGMFLAAFAVLTLLLLLLRRVSAKLCTAAAVLAAAVTVCLWIQGSFLVMHLPAMNGEEVCWGGYPIDRILSALLWLGVPVTALLLCRKIKGFESITALVSVGTALLLAVTLGTLLLTADMSAKEKPAAVTDRDMFVFSQDENLLIVVLDAVDGYAFDLAMARDEDYPGVFDDFTYYGNTVGGYPYSKLSIPLILTGQWYEAQQGVMEFERMAFEQSPLFARLERENYRSWLLVNDSNAYSAVDGDEFENITADRPKPDSALHMCKLLIKMSIIKHAPWDLKSLGYDLPGRLNEHIAFGGADGVHYYDWSDPVFYNSMKERNPITTVPEKCFKYIHLEGAHEPHRYDRDLNVLEKSPYLDVIESNFTMMELFLSRLKEAGVYDNTVIVVMSDHGSSNGEEFDTVNQHPILLIKGKNEHHELYCDDAPISFDDLQQAYLRLMDGADSGEVFDWHEGDERERRFFVYELTDSDHLEEYIQHGHAEDMETLLPSGRVFDLK